MTIRKLPKVEVKALADAAHWDAPSEALARWSELPLAADTGDDAVISIYEIIGEDFWTGGGFTAKRLEAALQAVGAKDVTVKINSPGGDLFEGLAIYNLLREHPAKVTVNIIGIAASAASIIAMAGDEIGMGLGAFLMIHNAWGVVVGNKNDFHEAGDVFDKFDQAMIDIYEARTGGKRDEIAAMMDAEEFLSGKEAVDKGFADELTGTAEPAESRAELPADIRAKRKIDALLAQSGMPRSERRRVMRDATGGKHDAAVTATHNAGNDWSGVALNLIQILKS